MLRPKTYSGRKLFSIYKLFGFTLASLLTYGAYFCDSIESLPGYMEPGLGQGACFLQSMSIDVFVFEFSNDKIFELFLQLQKAQIPNSFSGLFQMESCS